MLFNILFYEHFKKNYIQIIIFILVISLINPLQSVGLSRLYGHLFDIIHKNTTYKSFFDINNIFAYNIPGIIALISFVYIIIGILYLTKNYLETLIVPNYFKYLRELFFNNFIKKYSNDFKDVEIGEILSKIFELNMSVINLFLYVCNYFIATIIGLMAISIYYFYLDWRIGLIFFIGVVSVFILYYLNGSKQITNSIKKFNILYENNEKLTDRLSNLLNIYINNEQDNEINNFVKSENRLRKLYINNYWIEKKNVTSSEVIIITCIILILVLSYYSLKNKNISTVSFISIIVTLGAGVEYLFSLNNEISSCMYQLGIIYSNKDLLNEILYLKKRKIIDAKLKSGKIEFKNVSFGYGNKKKIFNNFNYVIKDKEKIAILGQSGSGKTTIMKILIDLHEINSGEILVDNVNIKKIDTTYLRKNIIYINQRTTLFNRSILDNMSYGTNKNNHHIIELLQKYDLMTIFNKLPKGIYTQAGVNGNNLSMGMQKITMIVRGVLKDGLIYAFDEPLTSLDSKSRKKVIKMLMEVLKDKTLIIITHDKEILPYINRTLYMNRVNN
jgi:ABC-type multidrug transport system fused ATPase/permease subunit